MGKHSGLLTLFVSESQCWSARDFGNFLGGEIGITIHLASDYLLAEYMEQWIDDSFHRWRRKIWSVSYVIYKWKLMSSTFDLRRFLNTLTSITIVWSRSRVVLFNFWRIRDEKDAHASSIIKFSLSWTRLFATGFWMKGVLIQAAISWVPRVVIS